MATTVVKTYRIPSALHKLILDEVERNSMSEADFIRLVLRHYFERSQESARIDALETRVIKVIEIESQRIESLIQQVISLAQPE
ncbi:hypothetical protein GALL_383020 [mine drainage metagenome]|uniref:Ribbon-helix-helix protein CopG domain-containing protein n=1 Tax=mine drainage metagenome TaxID=410659 RepID=A0A1J5QJ29_9ZZZZ